MENQLKKAELHAVVFSKVEPEQEQKKQLAVFLENKFKEPIPLSWREEKDLVSGFRLEIGRGHGDAWQLETVYDWSLEGKIAQLKEELQAKGSASGDVIALLDETIAGWEPEVIAQEIGTVISVGDGIATVSGLQSATYGEILIFSSGIRGMVQDLKQNYIGCILFGDDQSIVAGSSVRRSGKMAGVPVGDAFIGRVVDALGAPIDGKGEIKADGYRPIESPAPGIIDRQPVNEPMATGLIAIDAMFPIGRGQRELIIGDRQTGKTAIALDTIINQRGKEVICIYVAIGQKSSTVAQLVETLRVHEALDYSIVVSASASEAPPLQYIAPYAGCALGEYFMNTGRDVLIIYDDLSKHAIAYRALSLLLERSPGREAYPGDVFYLHSRLLERSAHLCDERGGGSMTALPIVETQAGDVSAYIPTNIISITDGQIFLESQLFFAGQRPAVNVGLSVSRVGGDAQTKAVKKASGSLRLDLAQYREMEVFTQFSSDLDDVTKRQLVYGQGLMQLLRQHQYHPFQQHEQVILLVSALNHLMQDVPAKEIGQFSQELLSYIQEKAVHICQEIDRKGLLSEEHKSEILSLAQEFIDQTRMKKSESRR